MTSGKEENGLEELCKGGAAHQREEGAAEEAWEEAKLK